MNNTLMFVFVAFALTLLACGGGQASSKALTASAESGTEPQAPVEEPTKPSGFSHCHGHDFQPVHN